MLAFIVDSSAGLEDHGDKFTVRALEAFVVLLVLLVETVGFARNFLVEMRWSHRTDHGDVDGEVSAVTPNGNEHVSWASLAEVFVTEDSFLL